MGADLDANGDEARDVLRAQSGDLDAFERLYHRHVGMVHSLARRMLGSTEADDATQRVFLHAWRKLPHHSGEGAFGGWLRSLAVRQLIDHWRTLPDKEAHLAPTREPTTSPRGSLEDALAVEAALAELPRRARIVLLLHDVEGFTHQEIARRLGVSTGTSKSQLHRARALMRSALSHNSPAFDTSS